MRNSEEKWTSVILVPVCRPHRPNYQLSHFHHHHTQENNSTIIQMFILFSANIVYWQTVIVNYINTLQTNVTSEMWSTAVQTSPRCFDTGANMLILPSIDDKVNPCHQQTAVLCICEILHYNYVIYQRKS